MIIYKVTNIINNKVYIGKTKESLNRRKSTHLCDAFTYHKNNYFQKALRKYGKENFRWEVLFESETITEKELFDLERYYIKLYDSFGVGGYNSTKGGEGAEGYKFTAVQRRNLSLAHVGQTSWSKGKKGVYSKESLKKMSESHKGMTTWIKGKKHTEESKIKMSKAKIGHIPWNKNKKLIGFVPWMKGKKHTEEAKKKMKGKKHTEETKNKISIAKQGHTSWNKGKKLSNEHRMNIGKTLKGRTAWNKGKKMTKEYKLELKQDIA